MNKRVAGLLVFSLIILALAGCGVNYEPVETGVFVKRDKTLEGAYVDDFSENYYNEDELTKMGQQEVQDYNKQTAQLDFYSSEQTKQTLPVSLDLISKRSDKILVKMSYATAQDYMNFNSDRIKENGGTTIYTESIEKTTIPLTGEFKKPDGSLISISEIAKNGSHQIVYANYKENVTVEGEIAYVSSNVTCNSEKNASTVGGQDSFIIFN